MKCSDQYFSQKQHSPLDASANSVFVTLNKYLYNNQLSKELERPGIGFVCDRILMGSYDELPLTFLVHVRNLTGYVSENETLSFRSFY
jgi:hypothetical protein